MPIDRESTIAEIVLEHSECAKVFCDHRVDFCCRGDRSLTVACAEKGLDLEVVCGDLERAIAGREERHEPDPRAMSTAELVSFIVSRHHAYLYEALPFLEPLATKVARVHGEHNPKLLGIRDTFRELAERLEPHLREEEAVLFPALTAQQPDDRLVASELASAQQDHLQVGDLLARLRAQADDYTSPAWACGSYRTLMRELAALEMDTLRHVHLETHVVAPRFKAARASAPAST
ncbi:MAG: iron-sulfur cluster repair di-iron protein [Myxococcales bacterium]|jgi:regulator of cell morphogenesis and NO signaling|nr:iron-sulfur cluster repair di-iron protein [Myxococcales bacterium]MBL0196332.1 iron-sulfur cluster repair di-iron protein [Myxococcales bacterium]HQY62334.1 iron-sulfur cluster repair di-iron protein [Polyangiaceae bacterium]